MNRFIMHSLSIFFYILEGMEGEGTTGAIEDYVLFLSIINF